MTLRRIILLFWGLLILLAGFNFWLLQTANVKSHSDIQHEAGAALASGLASHVGYHLKTLSLQVEALALSLSTTELKQLPHILRHDAIPIQNCHQAYIVSAEQRDPIQSLIPPLGFAELDLVLATSQFDPAPSLHVSGKTGAEYLAIARKIVGFKHDKAVLLVFCDSNWLRQVLIQASAGPFRYDLVRKGDVLISAGFASSSQQADTITLEESDDWQIQYATKQESKRGGAGYGFAGGYLISISILCLLLYRYLSQTLQRDRKSILQAATDLMINKAQGAYPVHFRELQDIISQMALLKRMQTNRVASEKKRDSRPDNDLFLTDDGAELLQFNDPSTGLSELDSLQLTDQAEIKRSDQNASDVVLSEQNGMVVLQSSAKDSADCLYRFGRAFASLVRCNITHSVLIGYSGSTHASLSESLKSLLSGIQASGIEAIYCGICYLPMLRMSMDDAEVRTTLYIDAEHDDSLFRVYCWDKGIPLTSDQFSKLLEIYNQQDFYSSVGSYRTLSTVENYWKRLRVDIQATVSLKLLVDCKEGPIAELLVPFLQDIGHSVQLIHTQMAECDDDHIAVLTSSLNMHQADVGVALLDSGTRLLMISSSGKRITVDQVMILLVRDILVRNPGSEVMIDAASSRTVVAEIVKLGGKPILTPPDPIRMEGVAGQNPTILASDESGRFILNDRWGNYSDGIYAFFRFLELATTEARNIDACLDALPFYPQTGQLTFTIPDLAMSLGELLPALKAASPFDSARVSEERGLRYDFKDGWCLIDVDKGIGAIHCWIEGTDQQALDRIKQQLQSWVQRVVPSFKLPLDL